MRWTEVRRHPIESLWMRCDRDPDLHPPCKLLTCLSPYHFVVGRFLQSGISQPPHSAAFAFQMIARHRNPCNDCVCRVQFSCDQIGHVGECDYCLRWPVSFKELKESKPTNR